MKVLLHVCCGPCTIYPLQTLREQGHRVKGYFFNPNIHPYREFKRRMQSVDKLGEQNNFSIEVDRDYGLTKYLQKVVFNERNRCSICYTMRLKQAAKKAGQLKFDAFTTTLLYSRYQNHDLIKQLGDEFGREHGVQFHYDDYRKGWQEGIDKSIAMDLYRQPYCGCIYSEQERFDKQLQKKLRKQ